MKKLMILTVLCFGCFGPMRAFTNLQDLQTYSAQHEEYPDGDTAQWLDQSYATLYRAQEPGFFTRVGRWMHFVPQSLWNLQVLESKLEQAVRAIDKEKRYDVVVGTLVNEPLHFVVISGLHGAFHSFVRIVTDLQSKGIINEKLEIAGTSTYIVFNGDVIAGSPYVLETMTVILMLMERNPGKVWYLQGKAELDQDWRSHELGRQLIERCGTGCYNRIEGLLTLYFQALPQTGYVVDNARKAAFAFDPSGTSVKQWGTVLGSFFSDLQPNVVSMFSFFDRKETANTVAIKALIESRTAWETLKPVMPFELLKGTKPLAWILTSAQTRPYRQLYRFFYDAYALVEVTPKLEESTIRIMARDVRMNKNFEQQACFELLSGKPCAA